MWRSSKQINWRKNWTMSLISWTMRTLSSSKATCQTFSARTKTCSARSSKAKTPPWRHNKRAIRSLEITREAEKQAWCWQSLMCSRLSRATVILSSSYKKESVVCNESQKLNRCPWKLQLSSRLKKIRRFVCANLMTLSDASKNSKACSMNAPPM